LNILVATDLSARSDRALARGFLLAKELNGTLSILHVVDDKLPDALKTHSIEWARAELKRETERLSGATGVSATFNVCPGDPRTEIIRRADPRSTALIILGVHDRSKDAGFFATTTAGHVLKHSLPPVLLTMKEASETYRQVVVGVDFSIFCRAAIQQAMSIAPSACFSLVHSYHVPFKGFIGSREFSDEVRYEERQKLDGFLNEEMSNLVKRAIPMSIATQNVDTVLREGEPRSVLRQECARLDADLLVIATHGRPNVSRAIWGSVAVDFLDNPPCDLLVIRPY
jgi:nucleotide-binding universal stress UspA family protein